MSNLNAELADLKVTGEASVLHRPGAIRLDGYTLLVHAPDQHGPGIRTEDNGTHVADLCAALAETPNLEVVAKRFNTSSSHVEQALAYASAAGYVSQ